MSRTTAAAHGGHRTQQDRGAGKGVPEAGVETINSAKEERKSERFKENKNNDESGFGGETTLKHKQISPKKPKPPN